MRVLAIDPGAKPGFCVTQDGIIQWAGWKDTVEVDCFDALVIEDQHAATHIYRDGRKVRVSRASQQGLSFTAGRLFERFDAEKKYRIPVADWRRALWPPGELVTTRAWNHPPPAWKGLTAPKRTLATRLWYAYGFWVTHLPLTHQVDVLEAIGIAKAWARLTAVQQGKYLAK